MQDDSEVKANRKRDLEGYVTALIEEYKRLTRLPPSKWPTESLKGLRASVAAHLPPLMDRLTHLDPSESAAAQTKAEIEKIGASLAELDAEIASRAEPPRPPSPPDGTVHTAHSG